MISVPYTCTTVAYIDSIALPSVMPWAAMQLSLCVNGKRLHQSDSRNVDTTQEVRHR